MEFPKPLEIALNHTEEASKRCRWIIFIMQLSVVLVLSSLWLQEDSNWLMVRFRAAQGAVKLLTCQPELAYTNEAGYPLKKIDEHRTTAVPASREELDTQSICGKSPLLTTEEQKRALQYLGIWQYSLPQMRKNVADLQQLITTRVLGVSVPVLGTMFDINDLSVMAGLTFAILLSWFHFALRRQHDNVKKVFGMAELADSEGPGKSEGRPHLRMTYDLLAMTQVLAIPPGGSQDSRDISFSRRLSRLPNLIMWTAVLTQTVVVVDDISTMSYGDALGETVSHVETAIASCLLAYLFYRTIQCFRLMSETYQEWSTAYNRIHPHAVFVAGKKISGVKLAWVFLCIILTVHVLGERPDLLHQILNGFAYVLSPVIRGVLWVGRFNGWLAICIVLLLMAALFWHAFRRPIRWIRAVAWIFCGALVLDLAAHFLAVVLGQIQPEGFRHTMVGLFSLPVLVLASLNMIHVLRVPAEKG